MQTRCGVYSSASGDRAHRARPGQNSGPRSGPTGPTHPLGWAGGPVRAEPESDPSGTGPCQDRFGDNQALPVSEQIRLMLEATTTKTMLPGEWARLDQVMVSQRDKHGEKSSAWWFDSARAAWWRIVKSNEANDRRQGSVGR